MLDCHMKYVFEWKKNNSEKYDFFYTQKKYKKMYTKFCEDHE